MLDQKQVRRENYRKFKYKMLNQKQVRRENATTEIQTQNCPLKT